MMINKLIVNHLTMSTCRHVIVSVCLYIRLAALTVSAAISPSDFNAATPGLHSPQIEVSLSALPVDSAALNKKISAYRHHGFGGLFLISIPSGSNSWDRIAPIAEICRKNSLKLGCDFFAQKENPDLLCRVVCTNRIVTVGKQGKCTNAPVRIGRSERLISTVIIPVSYSNSLQKAFMNGCEKPALDEKCYEYTFKAVFGKPHIVNYLNQKYFKRSVNEFLLNAQLRLRHNYGTVLDTVRFPSVENTDLIWADNLPGWFRQDIDFDLIGNLPVLLLLRDSTDFSVRHIHARYQRSIRKLWRDSFAGNVRPLVHEAGLHTAISVNRTPMQPEELGAFFQYPVAVGSTNIWQRSLNRRLPGGNNIHNSTPLTGRIQGAGGALMSVVDSLFVDGATRLMFNESIEDISFGKSQFDSLSALCAYVNRCSLLLQNSEPAPGIFAVSKNLPPLLNRFAFDSITPQMLKDAEVKSGMIAFQSGRKSAVIVFSDEGIKRNKFLMKELSAKGVKALPFSGLAGVTPDFSWKSNDKNMKFSFLRRSALSSDLFMIRNESDVNGLVDLNFKIGKFSNISRWQPQDGKIVNIYNFRRSSSTQCVLTTPVRAGELFFIIFDH